MSKAADHFSIPIAEAAAVGHVNAGVHMYNALKNHVEQSSQQGTKPDGQLLFMTILPAVSNLSLGLEIFLKIHKYQHTNEYPRGHDIEKLGFDFPTASLESLRRAYLHSRTLPQFHDSLAFSVGRGNSSKPSTAGDDPATYEEAIRIVGTTYTKWRYIYEHFGKDDVGEAVSFKPLGVLADAVRTCIRGYKGDAVLRIKDEPGSLSAQFIPDHASAPSKDS